MVVGFHLHQDVVRGTLFLIATSPYSMGARGRFGHKSFDLAAGHDGGVVRIGHQHVLRVDLVRMPNHAEQAVRLRHAINGEGGVEDLVPAVLAVGLREHHQLYVGRVALQLAKGLHQVVDLVSGECQPKAGVGRLQRCPALPQHVDLGHGRGSQGGEQRMRAGAVKHHTFGHAVMQQRRQWCQLVKRERFLAQPTRLQLKAVMRDPLHPLHGQATVVGDVSRLGRPGRDRAEARRNDDQHAIGTAVIRFPVLQERLELGRHGRTGRQVGGDQVHKARGNATHIGFDGLQGRQ